MKTAALLLVLLSCPPTGAQTGGQFRSNVIGMRLGPASGESDFVLDVIAVGENEEERLLERGTEVRRTEWRRGDALTTETVTEKGAVSATRAYDAQMRLIEERNAEGRRLYRYRDGRLDRLEVLGPEGEPLYSERYAYTPAGRLREADRVYTDGSRTLSSFLFGGGRLLSERLEAGERVLTVRYDASGRLVSESERRGGALEWERSERYDAASGKLAETTEARKGSALRRLYDAAGRVVEETRTGAGAYRAAYTYDGEGRQVRLRRLGAAGTEEWLTEYDGEGRAARESYLARGRLQRVRVHTGEREWHDDLYRDGRAVLRVYFRADQKVGEERLP